MQVTRVGEAYSVTPIMVSIENTNIEVHLAKRSGKGGVVWVEYAMYNNVPLKAGMPAWDAIVESAKMGNFNEYIKE